MNDPLRRSAVVLIHDDKIALIRREVQGRVYYLFPGGGVEGDETLEQAAIREAHEELGLTVQLDDLLAVVAFNGRTQYYYRARATGGAFGRGDGVELTYSADSATGSYTPIWVPLDEVSIYDVRPRQLAAVLGMPLDHSTSWPLRINELRR